MIASDIQVLFTPPSGQCEVVSVIDKQIVCNVTGLDNSLGIVSVRVIKAGGSSGSYKEIGNLIQGNYYYYLL